MGRHATVRSGLIGNLGHVRLRCLFCLATLHNTTSQSSFVLIVQVAGQPNKYTWAFWWHSIVWGLFGDKKNHQNITRLHFQKKIHYITWLLVLEMYRRKVRWIALVAWMKLPFDMTAPGIEPGSTGRERRMLPWATLTSLQSINNVEWIFIIFYLHYSICLNFQIVLSWLRLQQTGGPGG